MVHRVALGVCVLAMGAFGMAAAMAADKTPLAGAWEAVGDGASVGVRFASPATPETVTIGCDGGSVRVFINVTLQEPVESGVIEIGTPGGVSVFNAEAFNDGQHLLAVDVEGNDPGLAILEARPDSFSVLAGGTTLVLPFDPAIAETLAACKD